MSNNYWLKKEISYNLIRLERRLANASNIKDKRKRLSELLRIRNDVKGLLKHYEESKFDDNFLFQKFTKNIKSFAFKLEKEYAKK